MSAGFVRAAITPLETTARLVIRMGVMQPSTARYGAYAEAVCSLLIRAGGSQAHSTLGTPAALEAVQVAPGVEMEALRELRSRYSSPQLEIRVPGTTVGTLQLATGSTAIPRSVS
eukprot:2142035-Prymnesium_polylepis.1